MSDKLGYYKSLLNLDYNDAVQSLIKKYGAALDDYFKESSYNKFLNGEVKSPTNGKTSRTKDGLYCHHIDEDKFLNLGNKDFILVRKPNFRYQTKDRLVYCSLIEHLILHTIITKKTNGEFGTPGLIVFLIPKVQEWYINKRKPKTGWEMNCYNTALISSDEAKDLLNDIKLYLKSVKVVQQYL